MISSLFLCALCWNAVFGATVVEKRDGRELNNPQQHQTGAYTTMYTTYDNALAALERQSGVGGPGGYLPPPAYSPYSLPPPPPSHGYGPPIPQPQQYDQYAVQPQGYGQQPQQYSAAGDSYSGSDPGFSMQTGFEGFLVPNPWYGLLPWGLEGGVVIAIGVIVFIVVKIALIFLFLKIFKIGRLFKDEEDDGEVRSYLPSYVNRQNLANMASAVFDAIDRYNEIEEKED